MDLAVENRDLIGMRDGVFFLKLTFIDFFLSHLPIRPTHVQASDVMSGTAAGQEAKSD